MGTLLSVSELERFYEIRRTVFSLKKETVRAVDGVSFDLEDAQTLGIVGESGSGKSTLARCISFLEPADRGDVTFMGRDWLRVPSKERKTLRPQMGIIFQDPYSSLNPRKRVARIISEPLEAREGSSQRELLRSKAIEALEDVGLGEDFLDKYPHEMSGGQRQRIAIARALSTRPRFLIADEPVSSLDVSVQAQIINLFLDLKERLSFAMLFISHDLNIVRFISDHVMVMYRGKIMEMGPAEDIFQTPFHPYTRMLTGRESNGDAPSAEPVLEHQGRPGCVFFSRCPERNKHCQTEVPRLSGPGSHRAACLQYAP
ncbi:MAG TPA: peptide ABC transporter substrate-binding protein [Deltaproteobacteria bacterium]|nr:peptide ABC transporter substrate-binding protein [Deltaproteobacteria bacterium]